MTILACGLNYKTAPLDMRERLVFPHEDLRTPLSALVSSGVAQEAAILSTCNRTEVYCHADEPKHILEWLGDYHGIPAANLNPHFYHYREENAVRHMIRVASGLDSMVLGEPQILGQMKRAYHLACEADTVGGFLNYLFSHVFSATKQIRTNTAIGANPISVAFAAVSLSKRIFTDISKATVLLIGSGETIQLATKYLRDNGVEKFLFTNRSLERAEFLASNVAGEGFPISQLPDRIHEADIIFSATASPIPVLGKGAVESAVKKRKRRPIFMVDLAVPRDIEPEVGNLNDVYLFNIDDLKRIVEDGMSERRDAVMDAEQIIDLETARFIKWQSSLNAVGAIRAYRDTIDGFRDVELKVALGLIEKGDCPKEVLSEMSRKLVNKIMHHPTSKMREIAEEGELELLNVIKRVFE